MKAVILAGGFGTRLAEETLIKPKPMVEIGGRPVLWHILKIYSHHGFNDFVICLGYKGHYIKEYFVNYFMHMSDVVVDLSLNEVQFQNTRAEPWRISLVDTGSATMTGGRIKRIKSHVEDDEAFFLTYGDGVADVDIADTLKFHREHGKLATMVSVHPPGRFGAIQTDETSTVKSFFEKPRGDGARVNGGFFVLSPKVIDEIDADETVWEQQPLKSLANKGELKAYEHDGFWQPMDTLRDKNHLEHLLDSGNAPWKTW